MSNPLPQRETYPLVSSDDTLVMVFRDQILAGSRPKLFVTALEAGTQIRVDSGANLTIDSFAAGGVLPSATTSFGGGTETSVTLPVGIFAPTNKVSVLHVLKGSVSVDLRSTTEVRSYFRQPSSLISTTGEPGGWPTATTS